VKPKVSVIIPCYNYADYLKICLQSVLAQTFQDFEIIVVDDSSTDHTPEVVKEFRDSRLRYVRHEKNLGPATAQNTGIKLACGEYIAAIGADDLMKPNNLAIKVAILERYPEVGLVHSNAEIIDEIGRVIGTACKETGLRDVQQERLFEKLLYGNFIVASSILVRKACYQKVGLYDPKLRYGEDWDMWLRLAYHYDFGYLDSPLVQHRLHQRSLRHQSYFENKDLLAMDKIIRKVFQEFDLASKGYSYQRIYWSNYFRMLNNKLGVLSLRHILKLYARGLRTYPRYLLSFNKNAVFLGKLIAYTVLPRPVLMRLRKQKYKARLHRLF
jgi:glycosyltransferase involved in cell wall biosynthesis